MSINYKNVNKELIDYIKKNILPEYDKNDKGHGILHILEVIRRSFELKESLNLDYLDDDVIFAIASCHDNGKYIDHKTHEKIAAERFYANQGFKKFFTDEQRKIIKEAIEDHRSSFEDTPRSDYGKLISSADRNSTIDIVPSNTMGASSFLEMRIAVICLNSKIMGVVGSTLPFTSTTTTSCLE